MQAYEGKVRFAESISKEERMLLFDAQTSGGLLIAVPPGEIDRFGQEMQMHTAGWWLIGEVDEIDRTPVIVER